MDLGLKGRVAAVTGGTRGIGLAIAELLAAEGANVAVCARSKASLESVRDRGWLTMEADMTSEGARSTSLTWRREVGPPGHPRQ